MNNTDERVRLLEFQVEHLRRELTLLTRKYEDIVYSAAWTLARPLKWIEATAHRRVGAIRNRRPSAASAPLAEPERGSDDLRAQITARITRMVARASVRD